MEYVMTNRLNWVAAKFVIKYVIAFVAEEVDELD